VAIRAVRTRKPIGFQKRRLGFENLETRQLLSVAAPTSIVFQPQTGQGSASLTSANNSSTSKELTFLVSGVTAGDTVNVYADGSTTAIATSAQPVASGATTITVTTGGSSALSDGFHVFTATQTSGSTASASSPGALVRVFANLALTLPTASATVGKAMSYTVQTNAPSGDVVTVAEGSNEPSGLTFNATTNTFTWTPTTAGTQTFTAALTDSIGNSTVGAVYVAVGAANGLTVIAPAPNIASGSPVLVAMDTTNTGTPNFSVTTSSSSDPTGSNLTATLVPQSNPVLKIVTSLGEMDLQLLENYTPNTVAHIISLVDSGAYTNTSFYRIIADFVSQGGISSNGSGSAIPVELNPDLRFTSTGLLAMANNGVDGNTSEFFITDPSTSNINNSDGSTTYPELGDGFLDFRYTIFGKLVAGENVREAIATTPVVPVTSGQASQPVTPPVIESMSIVNETTDGVLMLKASSTVTGTYTVNVSDGLGGTQSFTINIQSSHFDPPNPWVNPINGTDTISTAVNTPVSFTPTPGTAAGASAQVDVQLLRPVPGIPTAFVDNSYVPTISGSFELSVGSSTTSSITFNSNNLTNTASNLQTALQALGSGFSTTTVTAVAPTTSNPTSLSFTVTFASSESPVTYVSASSNLAANFSNSATSATATQTLTFTYAGPMPDTTNPDVTLTKNNDGSYTLTPTAAYQGIQFLEITAVTPVTGTFKLQVGSNSTESINFDSTNLAATAANMQAALQGLGAGFGTTTVTAVTPIPTLSPTVFSFTVTFPGSESLASYVAASTALPVTVTNSGVGATALQTLTFAESSPGTSWDSQAGVSPIYRAFVPILIGTQAAMPTTPKLASISVGGKTVTGSTLANNASSATELSFNVTGAVAGDTVSVYMDGGSTPIASGTVASGAKTITVTTDGTTRIADASHNFTVKQATPEDTLYGDFAVTSSGGYAPGVVSPAPASSVGSAASAGTTLTIGLVVLTQPTAVAQVGVPYTYTVQTSAPSGDTVTVMPIVMPSGMTFDGVSSFTWTPSNAQLNTAPTFSPVVFDSQARTATIGPLGISVIVGLPPVQVPLNSTLGGSVTVSFSGSQVLVYDNIAKAVITKGAFKSTDAITVDLPSGQANSVSVVLPTSANAAIPKEVLVEGASGSTNNQVTVVGTGGANTFTLAGNTVTANGLATQFDAVQKLTLNGSGGNSYFTLNSSTAPTAIVETGGYNTLDFSHDTSGVTVNLGLDNGKAQSIAPWSTTLSITGVISKLIGTAYADVLTGGPAAVTEIVGGSGNDTLTGGSGDNILLGGGGNDTIIGGAGRNLMIAGSGTCSLYASGTQNMIIAGSTNLAANDKALLNLLEQGPQISTSYSVRRARVAVARNPALQSLMPTFQDSGAHDTIFGHSNINNWFVVGKNDTVTG